jgi:cell shape-determining protein MreC
MKTLLIPIFVSFLVSSCGRQSTQISSVNVDTLASVYSELLVLNERYSLSKDSLSSQQYESDYREVLRSHEYSKERFVSELESVAQSPDQFRQLCDRALMNFQQMRRRASIPAQRGHS